MRKLFRQIHLWVSVPFGIFITLICFSGAMLVFETEITEACRHDVFYVKTVGERPLPVKELMEAVSATLPDSVSATGINISADPERTWQVTLSKPRRASVYVDPYTGEVTGKYERLGFFDTMFHLHRWLMGSSTRTAGDDEILWGKLLVGISTLMLVLILISGLVIWWPRTRKALKSSLTISVRKGWNRFWHDLHVAGGLYATIFLLALALTGLTWSFSWYRNGFYSLLGVETQSGGGHGAPATTASAPASDNRRGEGEGRGERSEGRGERGEGRGERGEGRGERSEGRGERGEGRGERGEGESHDEGRREHGEGRGERGEGRGEGRSHRSPYARWQEIYERLAEENPDYRQITLSNGSAAVALKSRNSLRATDRYRFNVRSGEITETTLYKDQPRDGKVRSTVYTIHVGSWGGMLTRILTFLSALLGATLPLTGYYLWIKRLMRKGKKEH